MLACHVRTCLGMQCMVPIANCVACWKAEEGKPYVLWVRSNEPMRVGGKSLQGTNPETLADNLLSNAWFRHAAGEGAKGPRLYDWARVRLLWSQEPQWEHWLLIRRNLRDIN